MVEVDLLKSLPLLSSIDNIDGYMNSRGIDIRTYHKGVTVRNHSDPCTTLDVVLSGNLAAYTLADNGSATTVFEFTSGSILGANLIFAEDNRYPLDIFCRSNCVIAHITQAVVEQFLHNYSFAIEYIKSMSRNSQGLNQKVVMYSHKTLRDNITDYLKTQAEVQHSNRVVLPVSKKELADFFGVQRPSLFRELKRMKEDGLIEITNRTVTMVQQRKKSTSD